MISTKLKVTIMSVLFLLLLILDIPEFVICMHAVPDEILDLPCVLIDVRISISDVNAEGLKIPVKMPESDYSPHRGRKLTGFQILEEICCAAEIKKHFSCHKGTLAYKRRKEIYFIKRINLILAFIGKLGTIFVLPPSSTPSVLRI
ncbi:MAG: hypothetical protein AB1847_00855 [bacterium]